MATSPADRWLQLEFAAEALHNLLAAKLRSVLALIGMIIGTASVITTINIGSISRHEIDQQFRALATDVVNMQFLQQGSERIMHRPLRYAQITAIMHAIPAPALPTPLAQTGEAIVINGRIRHMNAIATTENLAPLMGLKLAEGRFLSRFDGMQPFAVIGDKIAASEEGRPRLAVGDTLRIGTSVFTVIGILTTRSFHPLLDIDVDQSVFISIEAASRVSGQISVTALAGRVEPPLNAKAIQQQWQTALTERNLPFAVDVKEAGDIIDAMQKQKHLLLILFAAIAGVSLVMGAGGIVNIMLMSVTERRAEIGLRLAVGARQRDIVLLFLSETAVLSAVGGMAGLMLSVFFTYGFCLISGAEFMLSTVAVICGLAVTCVVGLASGYYPALQASRLDPAAALRAG